MAMEEIRVLHVFRNMNLGGSQALVMNIYNKIDRKKVQFDFLVSEDGIYDEEIKKMGGRIYKIPYITKVGQKQFAKELKQFFIKHKEYNIVHSHLNQITGVILEEAKKAGVTNRIAHSHSTNNRNNIIIKLYKSYLQSKIKDSATNLFACSKEAAKWLYKSNSENAKILVNGIDLKEYTFSEEKRKEVRESLKIGQDTIVVGHVGRMDYAKNHMFLLDIFHQYQKINSNSILLLVGDGTLRKKIEKRARKLNIIKKMIIIGERKASDYYNAMDIFTFPSLYEGFAIALVEAQASGLFCIVSDKVLAEINATGKCFFLPLKKNAEYWAKKIDKVLSSKKSNKRKNDVPYEKYDIKNIAKELEEFYLSLD